MRSALVAISVTVFGLMAPWEDVRANVDNEHSCAAPVVGPVRSGGWSLGYGFDADGTPNPDGKCKENLVLEGILCHFRSGSHAGYGIEPFTFEGQDDPNITHAEFDLYDNPTNPAEKCVDGWVLKNPIVRQPTTWQDTDIRDDFEQQAICGDMIKYCFAGHACRDEGGGPLCEGRIYCYDGEQFGAGTNAELFAERCYEADDGWRCRRAPYYYQVNAAAGEEPVFVNEYGHCDYEDPTCTVDFPRSDEWHNEPVETFTPVCTDNKCNDAIAGGEQQVFEYTGGDQAFVVPKGVTEVRMKIWGAGGGGTSHSSNTGGGGGYTEAVRDVTPGEEFVVVVGEGGKSNSAAPTYGFGGGGGAVDLAGAAGGGLSGIFSDDVVSQASVVAVAGGGGGASATGGTLANGGSGGGAEGGEGTSAGAGQYGPGVGGAGGTSQVAGVGGDVFGVGQDGESGDGMNGGKGGDAFAAGNGYGSGGGGGGGYFGGGGGSGDTQADTPNWVNDAGGGGGSGFCADDNVSCNMVAGNGQITPNIVDPDHRPGIGNGGQGGIDGGNGLVIIQWGQEGCDGEPSPPNAGCDPTTFSPPHLLTEHGEIHTATVCDFAGNCGVCDTPPFKFDNTPVCTAEDGNLGKTADGTLCGECDPDDDDCLCIKGDASKCRDDGPVNCYTNPFHDRCPGFQNPACIAEPFTPGCPVVNPCYPVEVYDGLDCPGDAARFCARNPYHYGCNIACELGDIDCNPEPPIPVGGGGGS